MKYSGHDIIKHTITSDKLHPSVKFGASGASDSSGMLDQPNWLEGNMRSITYIRNKPTFDKSIINERNVISLVGDTDNPGGRKYYGTDIYGKRGWYTGEGDTAYGRLDSINIWEENQIFRKAIAVGKDDIGTGLIADILGEVQIEGEIGSHDFNPELVGWKIVNPSGKSLLDIRGIITDELYAKAFIADLDLALLSGHIVTKSVTQVSRNFIVPNIGNVGTLYVEDLPGFPASQVFEDNDWIRLQVVNRVDGGLKWFKVWLTINPTTYNVAGDEKEGEQSFEVKVEYAGISGNAQGKTVYAGAAAQDWGQDGDGFIEQQAAGAPGSNRPYLRIGTWETDPSIPSNITSRVMLGNVTDSAGNEGVQIGYDKSSDKTVFFAGDSDYYIDWGVSAANELNISSKNFKLKAVSDVTGGLEIDSLDKRISLFSVYSSVLHDSLHVRIGESIPSSLAAPFYDQVVPNITATAPSWGVEGEEYSNEVEGYDDGYSLVWDFTAVSAAGSTYTIAIQGYRVDHDKWVTLYDYQKRFPVIGGSFDDHGVVFAHGYSKSRIYLKAGGSAVSPLPEVTLQDIKIRQYYPKMVVNEKGFFIRITPLVIRSFGSYTGALTTTASNIHSIGTSQIDDGAVTYIKIQNVTADRVLGRITAGTGVVEELTGANVRTIADVAQKQSSTTDATAGRGLIVGAFGLGGNTHVDVPDLTSVDVNRARFFRILDSATGGSGVTGSVISIPEGGTPTTTFLQVASTRAFIGYKIGSTGTPSWRELYHTGNRRSNAEDDLRYGQLTADNTWTGLNTFTTNEVRIQRESTLALRIGASGSPNQQLHLGVSTASSFGELQASKVGVGYNNLILNRQGGNVGIGTISRGARLDVYGNYAVNTQALGSVANTSAYFTLAGAFGLSIYVNTTGRSYLQSNRSDGATDTYDIGLQPLGGNVVIGGTSATTGFKLDVNGKTFMRDDLTTLANIGTDNFVSETNGWRATYAGHLDVRRLFSNELVAKTFIADVDLALLSGHMVSKSVTQLSRDFLVPNHTMTGTLYVEALPGHPTSQVFEDGDWIRMQIIDRTGGGLIWLEAWVTVNALTFTDLGGGEQSYTVTTQNSGLPSNSYVRAGAGAQDWGQDGDGVLQQNAFGDDTPWFQIMTWQSSPINPGNRTVHQRMGNLEGITNQVGYGLVTRKDNLSYVSKWYKDSNNWGIRGVVNGDTYFRLGDTNIISGWSFDVGKLYNLTDIVLDATNKRISLANGGMMFGYNVAAGKHGLRVDANNYWYSDGTAQWYIDANRYVKITDTVVEIKGTVNITGGSGIGSLTDFPGTLKTPAGTGLFLSSTHMGYYDHPNWKTYIGSNGNMILGNYAGAAAGLSWNQSAGLLDIRGRIVVQAGSDISAVDAIWPSDVSIEAYWAFDELSGLVAYDNSGNGNNGTLVGGVTRVDGVSGGALDFDGTNGYISLATALPMVSFSAWLNFNDIVDVRYFVEDSTNSSLGIRYNGSTFLVYGQTAAGSAVSWTKVNELVHFAVIQSGNDWDIFINSVKIGTSTGAGNITVEGIGRRGNGLYFDGIIDEPRIYSRALTEQEIRGLSKFISQASVANANNATRTTIEGGLVTTGRIELQDVNNVTKAGITGGGVNSDISIWAGSSYGGRDTALFRVDYDGKAWMTEGQIASWTIGDGLLYHEDLVTEVKVELDGSNQRLRFLHQDVPRVVISGESLPKLTTLTDPDSGTWYATLNHLIDSIPYPPNSFTGSVSSGTFSGDRADIVISCKLSYVKHESATNVNCQVSGNAQLTTDAGVVIKTIGTFSKVFSSEGSQTIELSTTLAEIADYKIRYNITIYDDSGYYYEEEYFNLTGSVRFGGATQADHKIDWSQYKNETMIARDGFYSFWGNDDFFYLNPGGGGVGWAHSIYAKGDMVFQCKAVGEDSAFMRFSAGRIDMYTAGLNAFRLFSLRNTAGTGNYDGEVRVFDSGGTKYLVLV